tara:strand:+ start:1032 stop:2789 length:1758 start_codon:yes stop_codon:yes gene_type:complete
MTTAYTPILQLALPVTGELNGTWGDVVNDNITSMVEQAIAGLATINTWTAASHTLTTANGTTDEARCAILECSGAPGAAATVICPASTKLYVIKNSVTGGYAVTLKTPAGTGISVPNGGTALLYCDGTNVVSGGGLNGDVVGPASATDNAVARYDGTTGKIIQNSAVTIADDGATVIAANSTTDGLRITQLGTGNALAVEDSANPDANPFVIDANGRTVLGNTTNILTSDLFEIHSTGSATSYASSIFNWSASSGFANQYFYRSKSGTVGTQGVVANADNIGSIRFAADDGTAFISAALILAAVDGTPGTNDMPGRLVFSTTADGASSPTERMRINNQGEVGIGGASQTAQRLYLAGTLAGATTAYGVLVSPTFSSDATANVFGARTNITLPSAASSLTSLYHYSARLASIGTTTVTSQFGFNVESTLIGATNNYGFYGNIPSGTGRYNFYASGTADNYFAGNVGLGTTTPAAKLAVVGTGYSPTITITDGATLNWNTALGQVAQVTLGGNRTFAAPTNLVDGGFYSLLIIQDGTGSRTISWNAVFDFTGGTAPTLSTAAGSKDLITWRSDGTNMLEVGRSLGVA